MKILYCNKYNFPFSGTEVYLFELMELMRAQGHQVALFAMADKRGLPTEYDRHFVPLIDFKTNQSGAMARAKMAAHAIYSSDARRRLARLIQEFQPDVAHVRNIYHHLSPSIFWELKKRRVPVVYHLNDFKLLCPSYNLVSHEKACERCRGGRFSRVVTEGCYQGPRGSALVLAAEAYFHKWLRTYEKCVDRFLAPSHFVREKLVENGWNAAKIDVLYHFQKLPRGETAVPSPDGPILYFGRLSPEKGVADLLRAMRRLPRIRLRIAGDGPQRAELEKLAGELDLRNVEFIGHVRGEELSPQIAQAPFTIFPSHAYETLGKSILESYALSRPVIASDLGSRRELVMEGKTGLLYRAGDIDQLAGAISFLYDRPALAAEMGSAGQDLVRERHAPETHYRDLVRLYESLVQTKPQRTTSPRIPLTTTKPRLRIAFLGGRGVISKYSGIEGYYEEVGRLLAEMGHEVTIYCRTYFTPPVEEHNGMRLIRLPTIRSKHMETVVHTLLSTLHAMCSHLDVVHYHALGPALFSFLPRWAGKKTTVTVQGLDWQRKKWGRIASAVLRLGERAAANFPNSTMVVSQTLQEHYRSRYGCKTTYVPNGGMIRERSKPSQILNWGLEPDRYILFLGRFSPEKNCQMLIDAYQKIDTTVKLVLAGGSSYSDEYTRRLRTHQSERVRLLDWVAGAELQELLTNAMLFVLPSDLEGLSLALLDAMAAGVCVLASDIPENRELVDGAGFTFQRGDVTDLERMIRLLLADSQVRKEAARAAQERIRAQYLWSQIALRIEREYLNLAGWQENATPVLAGAAPMTTMQHSA